MRDSPRGTCRDHCGSLVEGSVDDRAAAAVPPAYRLLAPSALHGRADAAAGAAGLLGFRATTLYILVLNLALDCARLGLPEALEVACALPQGGTISETPYVQTFG